MTRLAKDLLVWFKKNGRKNFPWQSNPANIYHVWLSEVMLQQTQVGTVISYFNNFISSFPNIVTLANANEDDVLSAWAGLGYYSRARNLHKTAKIIVSDYGGFFPTVFSDVIALPGIGHSTAGAILSLACNQPLPILDGNVKRVLSRYHRINGHYSSNDVLKKLWSLARLHTSKNQTANYTQAIMDLGAIVCRIQNPKCSICPISSHCEAFIWKSQESYPNKKIKKAMPEKSVALLIYQNEKGEVYLEKRPSKGIWGGLWSFVEYKGNANEITKEIKYHNKNASIHKTLKSFKHSFSHYHLWISPIIISSPGGLNGYYPTKNIKLGLPAPIKKIMTSLDSANHS